jgi:hypothetical protein
MPYRRLVMACFACVVTWSVPLLVSARSEVVVESKTVNQLAGHTTVGVFISNDVGLNGIVLPLEIRSLDSGAYIADSLTFTAQGRVAASGLMDFVTYRRMGTPRENNFCSGPVSSSYESDAPIDFISPDAIFWGGVHTRSPNELAAGSDGEPGNGVPSFVLDIGLTTVPGQFVIDTCCVLPANHLAFTNFAGHDPIPTFTKGIITISDSCVCPCAADPVCDSVIDVVDVVAVVDEAFRSMPAVTGTACPHISRSDANCDCVVDVLDIVALIDRLYRGRTTPFCDPCINKCR